MVGRLETSVSDFGDGKLFVVSLLGGDDRRVGGQREVNTRVRDQVSLELGLIHVQCTVDSERS